MDEANGSVEEREKKEEDEDQAIDNMPDGEFEEMPRMEQADMHCPPPTGHGLSHSGKRMDAM